jgi:hypothetical protein
VLRPGDGFPDPARIRTLIVGRGPSLRLAASTIEHLRLAGQTAIFETPEKAMAALHRR